MNSITESHICKIKQWYNWKLMHDENRKSIQIYSKLMHWMLEKTMVICIIFYVEMEPNLEYHSETEPMTFCVRKNQNQN